MRIDDFQCEDLKRGLEPDECYYIQNAHRIRRHSPIDLPSDPPPDLVIEVEVTRHLLNRKHIHAQLGVPELWHVRRRKLEFNRLEAGKYLPSPTSVAFPWLTSEAIQPFLDRAAALDETTLVKSFWDWVKKNAPRC